MIHAKQFRSRRTTQAFTSTITLSRSLGGKDHNALEDCFSKIEEKWPGIVDRLHRRENVNDSLIDILQFMILQRARVPASRDATERIDAERTLAAVRRLDSAC